MAKKATAKAATKTEMVRNLTERTGMTKADVVKFLEEFDDYIKDQLCNGPGVVTLHGLLKIRVVDKPALPKRQVRNPRTGEMMWAKPKPASKAVRATPLKALKETVMTGKKGGKKKPAKKKTTRRK